MAKNPLLCESKIYSSFQSKTFRFSKQSSVSKWNHVLLCKRLINLLITFDIKRISPTHLKCKNTHVISHQINDSINRCSWCICSCSDVPCHKTSCFMYPLSTVIITTNTTFTIVLMPLDLSNTWIRLMKKVQINYIKSTTKQFTIFIVWWRLKSKPPHCIPGRRFHQTTMLMG